LSQQYRNDVGNWAPLVRAPSQWPALASIADTNQSYLRGLLVTDSVEEVGDRIELVAPDDL
jgi:hypothetical protein